MTFPVIFSNSTRIISLLVLSCLLQACSAVKLTYNQAPELAYWYLDGYVDFSTEQSVQVKDELNKLQVWHRQTQLPIYIDTLQKLQQKIPLDVNAQDACSILLDIRRKFVVLSDQTQLTVVGMMDTLTPSQLGVMTRKFEKGNAEFRKDYLKTAKPANQGKRYKDAVSRAERLYGRLDDKQLAMVAIQMENSGFNANLAYAERQRRQQDALQTIRAVLKDPATTEQKKLAVRNLFERLLISPNPGYVDYVDALTKESCKNFADLHNTTTVNQRRKAVETLTGYEQDMKTLSAQGKG